MRDTVTLADDFLSGTVSAAHGGTTTVVDFAIQPQGGTLKAGLAQWHQKAEGKVRMMADGSAAYTKALGLELDLVARGMGVRSQRYSMLVEDGVVKALHVEGPGKFEVSDADTMLKNDLK